MHAERRLQVAASRTGAWNDVEPSSSRGTQQSGTGRRSRIVSPFRPDQSGLGEDQTTEASAQNSWATDERRSERLSSADSADPQNGWSSSRDAQTRDTSARGARNWADQPSTSSSASWTSASAGQEGSRTRTRGEPVIPDASWASPDSPPLTPPQGYGPRSSQQDRSIRDRSQAVTSGGTRAGRNVRKGGLWGRQSYESSAEQPSSPASSSGVDDWGNTAPLPPEVEDGWGNYAASASGRWGASAAGNGTTARSDEASSSSAWAEVGAGGDAARGSWADRDARPASSVQDPEVVGEDGVWDEEEGDDEEDEEGQEEWEVDGEAPDITPLAPREADELLPVVPTTEQMGASWGDAVEVWQRLGASALVTLLACKLNLTLLASGSLTYIFWGPILGATNRNRAVRQIGRHVGLWRTSVLDITVERPDQRRYSRRTADVADGVSVRLLLGDQSGARSQLTVPFNRRYEQVQVGEPAEVIVLSSKSGFDTFKALKEVYLPESGLWVLADYPHLNRSLFLDISLDIERIRRQEMSEGAFDAVA